MGSLTTHNRANYAVCKICYDSKDNDGYARVKNNPDNEVACSAMHPFPPYKTNDPDLWNWKTGMGA